MNQVYGAYQESIRDFFQQFAYLDLLVRPGPAQPGDGWAFCARVTCDGGADAVTVLLTPQALQLIADGFSGQADQDMPGEPPADLVAEMANILAGQLYELTHAGRKPRDIGVPAILSQSQAALDWQQADAAQRFILTDEGQVLGGLLIAHTEGWSAEWS